MMQKFILMTNPVPLWENDEAKYYKLEHSNEGAILKVSWVYGIRQYQFFMTEISNTLTVDHYMAAGMLEVVKGQKWISYLIIKFPGEMENNLRQDEKTKLQKAAIWRYQKKYGMINLYVLMFAGDVCLFFMLLRRTKDQYFIYDLKTKTKRAYIYDWLSARHEDLEDGTLHDFGGTLEVNWK